MENDNQTPKVENEEIPQTPEKGTEIANQEAVEPDYKEKFAGSTREAQRLADELASKEEKIAQLEQTILEKDTPEGYDFWDEEKKILWQNQKKIEIDVAVIKAKGMWEDDFKALPDELKNKIAKNGGESEFKKFACSPDNRGQKNLNNLAKAFTFGMKEDVIPPPPPKGLEGAIGGVDPVEIKPEGTMTASESKALRESNPKKYEDLARKGLIKIIG